MLLTSAHNGLSQRLLTDLEELGHAVWLAVVSDSGAIAYVVPRRDPDLVVCPMLTVRIPAEIWRRWRCLIVHPGVVGDRGPSSLDWAIQERAREWGVTVLQADQQLDAGDVWAADTFAMRPARKSSIYRREVTEAASRAVLAAVARAQERGFAPAPLDRVGVGAGVAGRLRPRMVQSDRTIHWHGDPTDVVLAKLWAADGRPGVRDEVAGAPVHLFGGHREASLRGEPGALLATHNGAICRATIDGAVWITHAAATDNGGPALKLPAVAVVGSRDLPGARRWREITYVEEGPVGYLEFDFYNGALSTEQARRLRAALGHARGRPTRVLVLSGGHDFFCNGINLATIEASRSPGRESLRNLKALNAVVRDVITMSDKLTIAAVRGDAAAGGVMLALSADEVFARAGVILNPHYQSMGLFGSEYWTYLMPRRVGSRKAIELAAACDPLGTRRAFSLGLIDRAVEGDDAALFEAVRARALELAADPQHRRRIRNKATCRERDEAARPLDGYAAAELRRMRECFAPGAHYHAARGAFLRHRPAPPRPLEGPWTPAVALSPSH